MHSQYFNICSMVGWSIATIYNLGAHNYLSASPLSKYGTSVIFISYGPPYHTTYITYEFHGAYFACFWKSAAICDVNI